MIRLLCLSGVVFAVTGLAGAMAEEFAEDGSDVYGRVVAAARSAEEAETQDALFELAMNGRDVYERIAAASRPGTKRCFLAARKMPQSQWKKSQTLRTRSIMRSSRS